MGDDGRGDLVECPEPEGSNAPKVAGQIETPRPPDPIMRRPRADREEKRVIHGRDIGGKKQRNSLTSTTPIREDTQESEVSIARTPMRQKRHDGRRQYRR